MTEFFELFFGLIGDIISALDVTVFELFGFNVSLWSIILVFIIINMFAAVWWRGARG